MSRPPHLSLVVPQPLPECGLCEQPTRRAVYEDNGGLCSSCSEGITRIAQHVAGRLPPVLPYE